MIDLYEEFLSIVGALDRARIRHAVCGGIAVALYGYPRFTKDIDLLIHRDDLEKVMTEVKQLGYTLPSGLLPFDTGTPQEREVYRVSKAVDEELLTLDLVLVTPVFEGVWRETAVVEAGGCQISVVSLDGLKHMKQIAGRKQDIADIEQLELRRQGGADEPGASNGKRDRRH